VQCGFFSDIQKPGKNRPFEGILAQIKAGAWREEIERLRKLSEKEYQKQKKRLPALLPSASIQGGGHQRSHLRQHTGLLLIDVDKLRSHKVACELREHLRRDRHVFAAWVSPSGKGVKAAIQVPSDFTCHAASFEAARKWFLEEHGIEIDKSCSDPTRLCFVSFDPDLWVNEKAEELPALIPEEVKHKPQVPALPPSATSLQPAFYILHNIRAFRDFPALVPLYKSLVSKRYPTIQPGLRNEALCDIVPRLHSAIDERFIPSFAEAFYQDHSAIFTGSLSEHLEEAASLQRGCAGGFVAGQLSEQEGVAYESLDDRHKTAFRVCHALAICKHEEFPPPLFFLGCDNLAARLGVLPMTAHRLLGKLTSAGIIATVEKGKLRASGEKSRATSFRWLLPSKLAGDGGTL